MKILEFFSKYQKFILFSCLLLAVLSFIDKTLAVGAIFIAFLVSVTFFLICKSKEEKQRKFLITLFLIIFLLHILGVLFVYYTNFMPFSGEGDYIEYNIAAQKISERIHQGNFSLQNLEIGMYYPVIVGYIYALIVPDVLIGEIFNAWLVALIAVFIYLIIREIGRSEKEGFLVGLMVGVYPSLAFFGSLLLKDASVVLLCMVGLLLTLKIIKRFSWSKFFIFYIILIGLTNFRFYIGYALMLSFIISWFLLSVLRFKKRIVYGIIIIFLFGFVPQISSGYGYFGAIVLKQYLNTEVITAYREVLYAPSVQSSETPTPETPAASETPASQTSPPQTPAPSPRARGSSVVVKTGFENPITFVKNTSISFIYCLLGPFPWQVRKAAHLFALPETISWYFLLFFIVKGIAKYIRKQYRDILPLVIFSIIVFGVVSLFISNFGIITRIRMPAFLALLCLFPLGSAKLKSIKIPLFKFLDV